MRVAPTRPTALAALAALALLAVVAGSALGAGQRPRGFGVAAEGCAMSHCSPSMADQVMAPAPRRIVSEWHDPASARTDQGLGCSGNTHVALCTVKGRTIIFDGDRETASSPPSPRFFAVRDMGERPRLIWQRPLEGPGVASAALDPRGGAWVFAFAKRPLWRLSTRSGQIIQRLDLDALVDEPEIHVPLSALSIAAGPKGHPAMILTARSSSSAFVAAIDLEREKLLWKHRLPGPVRTSTPMGQFPVLTRPKGESTVVFTALSGVRGIRGPASAPARKRQRRPMERPELDSNQRPTP